MAKVQTSALIGPALDWAVAKCVNPIRGGMVGTHQDNKDQWHVTMQGERGNYAPSTDWLQGGSIIEHYITKIEDYGDCWYATNRGGDCGFGPTPLIAAMRCFVVSKLGPVVDVPEELAK